MTTENASVARLRRSTGAFISPRFCKLVNRPQAPASQHHPAAVPLPPASQPQPVFAHSNGMVAPAAHVASPLDGHIRVNMVNARKEYFRVSLDEIRVAVQKHHGLLTFVLTPEAEEWRKTCAMAEVSHGGAPSQTSNRQSNV